MSEEEWKKAFMKQFLSYFFEEDARDENFVRTVEATADEAWKRREEGEDPEDAADEEVTEWHDNA